MIRIICMLYFGSDIKQSAATMLSVWFSQAILFLCLFWEHTGAALRATTMLRKKMTIDSISHKRAQISENVCLEIETIVPCASMSAGLGAVCNSVSASPGGSRNGRNSRSPPPAAVIRPTRAYLTAMGSRRPMGISVRRRRPGSAVDSVPPRPEKEPRLATAPPALARRRHGI
jgi:hypothetical protein